MAKVIYGNTNDKKIEKGDVVAYTSGQHGDSKENPLWNGQFGKIRGKVMSTAGAGAGGKNLAIRVYWPSFETTNIYSLDDLNIIARSRDNIAAEEPGPEIKIKGLFNVGD